MSEKHLHIVSFDVPYPPNYGGVIDVFYKLKSLHKIGVKIILHCFKYRRSEAEELNRYCDQIFYYERDTSFLKLLSPYPFITITRHSSLLLKRLMQDNFPILFEGLHSSFLISNPKIAQRQKLVRMHNVEHDYYNALAKTERKLFKKYYFKLEAIKLKWFQQKLKHADNILAISPNDNDYFNSIFKNVTYLPAFHPNEEVKIQKEIEDFALYHGNLGVGENNEAALFLISQVFKNTKLKLVIAGNGAGDELKRAISNSTHIELMEGLKSEELLTLIHRARVNILVTFQATGIKLKLLNALYLGGHCLVNPQMIENTGLESLCTIGKDASDLRTKLKELMQKSPNASVTEKRKKVLGKYFDNIENAKKLFNILCESLH